MIINSHRLRDARRKNVRDAGCVNPGSHRQCELYGVSRTCLLTSSSSCSSSAHRDCARSRSFLSCSKSSVKICTCASSMRMWSCNTRRPILYHVKQMQGLVHNTQAVVKHQTRCRSLDFLAKPQNMLPSLVVGSQHASDVVGTCPVFSSRGRAIVISMVKVEGGGNHG